MWVRIERVFFTRNPQGDAILRGEASGDGYHWHVGNLPIIADVRRGTAPNWHR